MLVENSQAEFGPTPWTLVECLQGGDAALRTRAVEQLTTIYWPCLYAMLRKSGFGPDDAEELVQGFMADKMLVGSVLERARREKGRVRGLLCTAVRNYSIEKWRREQSDQRARCVVGSRRRSEESLLAECPSEDAERAAMNRLALEVLEQALDRCEQHFLSTGRQRHWRLFDARVVSPSVADREPPTMAESAAECGFASPEAGSAAIQVVRERLWVLVRQIALEITTSVEEAEEILHVIRKSKKR